MTLRKLSYTKEELKEIYKEISNEIFNKQCFMYINGEHILTETIYFFKCLQNLLVHMFIKFGKGSHHLLGTCPNNLFVYFYIQDSYCILYYTNTSKEQNLFNIIENVGNEHFKNFLLLNSKYA